jgi:hypothetical protein
MFPDSFGSERDLSSRREGLLGLARIIFIPPAALVYLVVHLARGLQRWYLSARAKNWTKTDAWVSGSYQLDESQGLLSLHGWSEWDGLDAINEDERQNEADYRERLAVAIEYNYRADGEVRSGTYFLPYMFKEGDMASQAEKAWVGRKIVVRYNPVRPDQSFFLVQDGAPGKPHIPRPLSYRPYLTGLSLK